MPAGHKGSINISTKYQDNQVVCEIGDNGPGIPESIRHRIFEPFFTTKAPGMGTGLGLSISYDIVVNKHHGELKVACPASGGTVFSIILPRDQQECSENT
jgi:signal transduction histidine kinase